MKVNETDDVLTLTSGGCNALNLLLHGAGHVSPRIDHSPKTIKYSFYPASQLKCRGHAQNSCLGFHPHVTRRNLRLEKALLKAPIDCETPEQYSPNHDGLSSEALTLASWGLQVASVDCNPAQSALLELKATAIRCAKLLLLYANDPQLAQDS